MRILPDKQGLPVNGYGGGPAAALLLRQRRQRGEGRLPRPPATRRTRARGSSPQGASVPSSAGGWGPGKMVMCRKAGHSRPSRPRRSSQPRAAPPPRRRELRQPGPVPKRMNDRAPRSRSAGQPRRHDPGMPAHRACGRAGRALDGRGPPVGLSMTRRKTGEGGTAGCRRADGGRAGPAAAGGRRCPRWSRPPHPAPRPRRPPTRPRPAPAPGPAPPQAGRRRPAPARRPRPGSGTRCLPQPPSPGFIPGHAEPHRGTAPVQGATGTSSRHPDRGSSHTRKRPERAGLRTDG